VGSKSQPESNAQKHSAEYDEESTEWGKHGAGSRDKGLVCSADSCFPRSLRLLDDSEAKMSQTSKRDRSALTTKPTPTR
jgi:hypothetical protein